MMTIDEKIKNAQSELNSNALKLQQLAQMQDQLISQQNKLVGKLEAYEELLKESTESDASEEKANGENSNNQGE